jgi:hypothetical protein
MDDNGKGTLKENIKVVKQENKNRKIKGTPPLKAIISYRYPDPAHLIQRVEIHGRFDYY